MKEIQNKPEESIRSLEKENGNPKRVVIVEKKEIPAIVQELLRLRSNILKQYFYLLLQNHQTRRIAKRLKREMRIIDESVKLYQELEK